MQDILFKTDDYVFSYRISGILIRDGKVLLQKPASDDGYSLPGGHVSFGETTDETLVREFKEEIGAEIRVERLALVSENFFPWGNKPCQQISLYYFVSLKRENIPLDGVFRAFDELGGERIDLDFCWIPTEQLDKITVYPEGVAEYIKNPPHEIKHFVYKE